MKKFFKTLSFAVVGALLLSVAGPLRPAFAGASDSYYFDTATIVNVSSTSATKLVSKLNGGSAEIFLYCTMQNLPSDGVLIQTSSTSFSTSTTTGTARIPCLANTTQQVFIDFGFYSGDLWALASATTSIPVNIWRKKY